MQVDESLFCAICHGVLERPLIFCIEVSRSVAARLDDVAEADISGARPLALVCCVRATPTARLAWRHGRLRGRAAARSAGDDDLGAGCPCCTTVCSRVSRRPSVVDLMMQATSRRGRRIGTQHRCGAPDRQAGGEVRHLHVERAIGAPQEAPVSQLCQAAGYQAHPANSLTN